MLWLQAIFKNEVLNATKMAKVFMGLVLSKLVTKGNLLRTEEWS